MYQLEHRLSSGTDNLGHVCKTMFAESDGLIKVSAIVCLLLCCFQSQASGTSQLYQGQTDKPLKQVLEDAEFAITERNFRITGRLHIGEGIRERGNSEFPDYEVILFCNLTHAEHMLELDPEYVNYCPGRISFRSKNNIIIVSAPLLPGNPGNAQLNLLLKKINQLIREIVDFSIQEWSETQPE